METYTLAQFPPHVNTIHVATFRNVVNAPEIRKRLVGAATTPGPAGDALREEVDFAFIEGDLIVSPNHLLTAIQTTLIGALTPTGDLKTKSHNIHSEILLSLSPNNNITDSIRRHGLSDKTTNLIVVRVGSAEATQEDIWKLVDGVVRGELVRLEEVRRAVDWSRVDKTYKLSEMNTLKLSDDELTERKTAAVISTVAIRSVL